MYIILTGRRLNCHYWTELPIPDEAVQNIEKIPRRHDHGYNFTFRNCTAILSNDDTDDARYGHYDHKDDDEYPSLHHDGIIYPDISGVDGNINDDDDDNNTDNANTNADNTNAHDDSDINFQQ